MTTPAQPKPTRRAWMDQHAATIRPIPPMVDAAELVRRGLDALGGTGNTWAERLPQITAWREAMRRADRDLTWQQAFDAGRMSIRQINIGSTARYGVLEIGQEADPLNSAKEKIFFARDPGAITERMKPENFTHDVGKKSEKNAKGLHALSASLLDPRCGIDSQLKGYKDVIALFFPVPTERDLQILRAVSQLAGADESWLITLRSEMTRVEGAHNADMHTTLTYRYTPGGSRFGARPVSVRYGLAGTWKDEQQQTHQVDRAALERRDLLALQHRLVVDHPIETVNEIIMSYRRHENTRFPLFAQWDGKDKRFWIGTPEPTREFVAYGEYLAKKWKNQPVAKELSRPNLTHTFRRTGGYITDDGVLVPNG